MTIFYLYGGHVNWRKSFLYPVNYVPSVEILKTILGDEAGALPSPLAELAFQNLKKLTHE